MHDDRVCLLKGRAEQPGARAAGVHGEGVVLPVDAEAPPSDSVGAPIDAIHAGFKTEVRRRAMEEAF